MAKLLVLLSLAAFASANSYTASKLVKNIYNECLSQYSVECVKPRTLQWISQVSNDEEIKITDDLSIVKTATIDGDMELDPRMASDPAYQIVDKVDRFLQTHTLKVKVPEEISNSATSEYVPRSLLADLPSELEMPLDGEEDGQVFEGRKKKIKLPKPLRIKSSSYNCYLSLWKLNASVFNKYLLCIFSEHGFIKKVLLPFLLGLKFKASVLVPLALALIALKTWKALTLGLISLVLSGTFNKQNLNTTFNKKSIYLGNINAHK